MSDKSNLGGLYKILQDVRHNFGVVIGKLQKVYVFTAPPVLQINLFGAPCS